MALPGGRQSTGLTADIYEVSGSDGDNVWVVAADATFAQHRCGTWAVHNPGLTALDQGPVTLRAFSATNVWLAAGSDKLYGWNGNSWRPTKVVGFLGQGVVWGASSQALWVAGGSLSLSSFNGADWSTFFNGNESFTLSSSIQSQPWRMWGLDANRIWQVGDGGSIAHRQAP